MAKVFLVGIQDMNFPTKDGKDVIDGISLYCNYPDRNVIGLISDKKFISPGNLQFCRFYERVSRSLRTAYR